MHGHVGARVLNSGPHGCTVSASLADPSPQTLSQCCVLLLAARSGVIAPPAPSTPHVAASPPSSHPRRADGHDIKGDPKGEAELKSAPKAQDPVRVT